MTSASPPATTSSTATATAPGRSHRPCRSSLTSRSALDGPTTTERERTRRGAGHGQRTAESQQAAVLDPCRAAATGGRGTARDGGHLRGLEGSAECRRGGRQRQRRDDVALLTLRLLAEGGRVEPVHHDDRGA